MRKISTYKPPKHHRIRVNETKLGRTDKVYKVAGDVDKPPFRKTVEIRIDPRQNGLSKLDTLVHEILHLFDPELSETKVRKMATYIAKGLWKNGYRK